MGKYILGILAGLLIILGGVIFFVLNPGLVKGPPVVPFSGDQINPNLGSSFGQFGMGYHYGENTNGVIVGWPGKIKDFDRPIWMVILKYPEKKLENTYTDKRNSSGDEWDIYYEGTIKGLPNGKEWNGIYSVSSKNPLEVFKANDTTYSPEKGRIFLVDLTGIEPQIQQINEDPQKIFIKPKNPADPRPEIRETLENLKTRFHEVADFLKN